MRLETVTSAQNPKIRTLLALQEKSRLRREMGLFVVEGRRELEHCIEAGYVIDTIFNCPEISGLTSEDVAVLSGGVTGCVPSAAQTPPILADGPLPLTKPRVATGSNLSHPSDLTVVEIPAALYGKVAYRGGTEGLIAEVRCREHSLSSLHLKENPLIIVLESVEKPGNLGAVLRSADAAGADAVIICDPLTDLYNPNLIRSSVGGIFTVPCATATSEEAIAWLKTAGIRIFTAQLQDSEWYYDTDLRRASAIIIGTEATGLTDCWRKAADAHIRIPMLGRLDSLNASVSAAILLYEAVRQRHAK